MIFLFPYVLFSQSDRELGMGIGSISNHYPVKSDDRFYYRTGLGAGIRLSYEEKLKQLSTGWLNWGAMLVYGRSDANYKRDAWNSRYVWNHVVLAGRLNYTYPVDDKLHLYGGLNLGIHLETFNEHYIPPIPANYEPNQYSNGGLYSGLYIGGNYYLKQNLALFSELGYDLMWFSVGIKMYL